MGLNTARTEQLRHLTLRSLNRIGKRQGVLFSQDLLFMRNADVCTSMEAAKVAGIRHFQSLGYRVFAMVDNEPSNLAAIARDHPDPYLLLLHADTIFESSAADVPATAVCGREYDPDGLTHERVA